MRQEDEAGGPQDTGKAQEPEGPAKKAGSKKDKYQKAQAKAEHAGEKLGKALPVQPVRGDCSRYPPSAPAFENSVYPVSFR